MNRQSTKWFTRKQYFKQFYWNNNWLKQTWMTTSDKPSYLSSKLHQKYFFFKKKPKFTSKQKQIHDSVRVEIDRVGNWSRLTTTTPNWLVRHIHLATIDRKTLSDFFVCLVEFITCQLLERTSRIWTWYWIDEQSKIFQEISIQKKTHCSFKIPLEQSWSKVIRCICP